MIDKYCLVKFHVNTGNVKKTYVSDDLNSMEIWAEENCPNNNGIIIFDRDTGLVISTYNGSKYGVSTRHFHSALAPLIETLAPGLMDAING